MATNKTSRKRKDEAGSKLGVKRNPAKRAIKVTAVDKVDFAPAPASAPATAEKREEPKERAAPKKPTAPGVRPMRSRPYVAGTIIAKHGLAAGVTEEMGKELDAAYGTDNPAEAMNTLRWSWHVARGYCGVAEDSVE